MILIDKRQGSIDLLPKLPPELSRLTELECGDVAWFGNGPDGLLTYPCGLEYKKVPDALQSFISGRYSGEQYPKMTEAYKRIYLLIEGEYREGQDGRVEIPSYRLGAKVWNSYGHTTYRMFDNWQNSLTETGHIIIKRSQNIEESAAQVLDLYRMWTKDYDQHKALFQFNNSQEPPLTHKASDQRLLYSRIPGVGYELSRRVEDKFDSVYDAVHAGEQEWTKVHGIGKQKAKSIVQFFRWKKT